MPSLPHRFVSYRGVASRLRSPDYERFAAQLYGHVAARREFHCRITTGAELRRLNRQFRGKDTATDVLSFPSLGNRTLGDIAISLPHARAQAREFGHPLESEVCVLMLHGLLHLTGLDHETDRGHMACAEKYWRERLALPVGLIERVPS